MSDNVKLSLMLLASSGLLCIGLILMTVAI